MYQNLTTVKKFGNLEERLQFLKKEWELCRFQFNTSLKHFSDLHKFVYFLNKVDKVSMTRIASYAGVDVSRIHDVIYSAEKKLKEKGGEKS